MKSILAFILLVLTAVKPADNVITRFNPPAGYTRITTTPGSFGRTCKP